MNFINWLRHLYRTLDTRGANRLRDARAVLDFAVRAAYGMKAEEDPLALLAQLRASLWREEGSVLL